MEIYQLERHEISYRVSPGVGALRPSDRVNEVIDGLVKTAAEKASRKDLRSGSFVNRFYTFASGGLLLNGGDVLDKLRDAPDGVDALALVVTVYEESGGRRAFVCLQDEIARDEGLAEDYRRLLEEPPPPVVRELFGRKQRAEGSA